MMRRVLTIRRLGALALGLSLVSLTGCAEILALFKKTAQSDGGSETWTMGIRPQVRPADVRVPEGYQVEAVAGGLTFPTGVVTDDENRAYVLEAGYAYGEEYAIPRILRLEPGGGFIEIARGSHGPWTGFSYHQGSFYVAEGANPGRILRVGMDGTITALVEGIPSKGDHHTNKPIVGPDGWLYFGQGAITNSAVVGLDNAVFGWLPRYPTLHDTPGQDITLNGDNFTTTNPLTAMPGDNATTGAFMPFGTPSRKGQVIKGGLPAHAAVMRLPVTGGKLELVAWGIRNPFGLAFSPDGRLFAVENAFDSRGSRPIESASDYLWEVRKGVWYGWPDFVGGVPVTDPRFKPEGQPQPKFLLAKHPNIPPKPTADLGIHTAAMGLDFSRSDAFGHRGQAFVAQFGDVAPVTGVVKSPAGFKVVRVNISNGQVSDFLVNKAGVGPASKVGGRGLERPIDVHFDRRGDMYILDFGIMTFINVKVDPKRKTGVLWRVKRS